MLQAEPKVGTRYKSVVRGGLKGFTGAVWRDRGSPRRSFERRPKSTRIRVRFDARQIAVRIRSETLGLRAGISRRPTGFGKLPVIELISCGSHDPSASLSCLATTIAA